MAKIFETHAHYEDKAFDADRDELIKSLPAGDIEYVVNMRPLNLTKKLTYHNN